ncbi:hypothetical protein PoB_006451000 [Plakobranchus ocellatus]|uniref:Uncharacterized protein n=1 Tax=Plakobranchus ocellatus TaxID=259542 RepID=A0AAV4D1M3_9GAST|nr:hypothetical protein PoB_006451000 [Plakobranchus ocellatus]
MQQARAPLLATSLGDQTSGAYAAHVGGRGLRHHCDGHTLERVGCHSLPTPLFRLGDRRITALTANLNRRRAGVLVVKRQRAATYRLIDVCKLHYCLYRKAAIDTSCFTPTSARQSRHNYFRLEDETCRANIRKRKSRDDDKDDDNDNNSNRNKNNNIIGT